jgi:hypothetical protein
LYRSRDKIKGYEQGRQAIASSFHTVFTGIEQIDNLTAASIYEQLRVTYPKTNTTTLTKAASNIARMLDPFTPRWEKMDEQVKAKLLQDISARYALSWYNTNIEALGE